MEYDQGATRSTFTVTLSLPALRLYDMDSGETDRSLKELAGSSAGWSWRRPVRYS